MAILTNDVIVAEALSVLDNNLLMADMVYRGYEDEFTQTDRGYKPGDTISIRRPVDYTVREGRVVNVQVPNEGKLPLTVDKQAGIDLKFTSKDLTLEISKFSERFLQPGMVQLANYVDQKIMDNYKKIPNWVGTPASPINSWSDFAKGPERLDEYAVPSVGRAAVLSPSDHWGFLGAQTGLYIQGAANDAYRNASLGRIAGIDMAMAQNVPTHTTGTRSGSILIDLSITTSTTTYDSVKDTMVQTIHMDAFGGATETVKAGDVFTIADVYAVNPVTKARLPFLKQFVVTTDVAASGSEADVIISPPLIWTGAHKNVDITAVTDLNDQAVTFMGAASTNWRQNMVFQKNAFALVMVPMEKPAGTVDVTRKSYKGLSARMIPFYDGKNDESYWRLDILFGTETIDPRLATRINGTT